MERKSGRGVREAGRRPRARPWHQPIGWL